MVLYGAKVVKVNLSIGYVFVQERAGYETVVDERGGCNRHLYGAGGDNIVVNGYLPRENASVR